VDIETICGEKMTSGMCKVRIEEGFSERYAIDSRMERLSPIEGGEKKLVAGTVVVQTSDTEDAMPSVGIKSL